MLIINHNSFFTETFRILIKSTENYLNIYFK